VNTIVFVFWEEGEQSILTTWKTYKSIAAIMSATIQINPVFRIVFN